MNTFTEEQFLIAVSENISIAGVLRQLNLKVAGGNYKTVNNLITKLQCNISHWKGMAHWKGITYEYRKHPSIISLEDILIENSTYTSTHSLKKRLIKESLLQNRCQICQISNWQNKQLSLALDHINGINNDNRLENLRLLCPNCHSQTDTFAGKNTKKHYKLLPNLNKLCECGNIKYRAALKCKICSIKSKAKIEWPELNTLLDMVNSTSYSAASRKLGISRQAIRMHILKYNTSCQI